MNRRRRLLIALGGSPLAGAGIAIAQQPAKLRRIGVVSIAEADRNLEWVKQRLRELGHVEGRSIVIELTPAKTYDRLPAVAAEVVRRNPDVILTIGGTPSAIAAKNASRALPIVFTGVADPVRQGIVTSLARPGGNVTGLSLQHPQTAAKTLELLREVVPSAKRIVLLANPTNDSHAFVLREMQGTARKLRLEVNVIEINRVEHLQHAVAESKQLGAQGLAVLADSWLTRYQDAIASLAITHGLPAIGGNASFADQGGLLSYGPNREAHFRRAAELVDKILKGANPADLPIEQPTKFDLIVNLKTANALGITIPQTVLVWADRVIK